METWVKVSLLLAVAVVFPVMVALGIEAFMPKPEVDYNECYSRFPVDREENQEEFDRRMVEEKDCQKRIEALIQPHEARVFGVTSVVGLAAVAVGALWFTSLTGPAGPGLVIGGIITILYGSLRTFDTVDKRWMFVVALGTLAGVVWVSRRWFKGGEK